MTRSPRDFRLIPVVLVATIGLFTLKVLGIAFDGGYTLTGPDGDAAANQVIAQAMAAASSPDRASRSWAQSMFGFPDVTGSVPAKKEGDQDAKGEAKKPVDPKPSPNGTPIPIANGNERPQSPAERAILERLTERRQELDARARELEIRENLLKAAEKRMEAKLAELKELEGRVSSASKKKEEADAANIKSLVVMYENMKAKDAAKIFDGLDIRVLLDVVKEINPRRMSDILAQMSPQTAERLTVEIATRSGAVSPAPATKDLPKIEGRPNGT
jgi:flagellar motility protein MotE (MotC chaperone)